MTKKLLLIETKSSFYHKYVFEVDDNKIGGDLTWKGKSFDEALDAGEITELSQKFIGEYIINSRRISKEKFLKIFDEDNDYLRRWNEDQKLTLINRVEENK